LLWIGSYLFPIRVAVLPWGDVAIGIASKHGEFGIIEMDWTGASSEPGFNYWQAVAMIAIGFAATYCGSSALRTAEVAGEGEVRGAFPVVGQRATQ
jgi:hypothetical protein